MTGHLLYTEEDVRLAARAFREVDSATEIVPYEDFARAVLAALSSANRLLPPGSEDDGDDYEVPLGTEENDHPTRPHDWYRPDTPRGPSRQQRCGRCGIWETVVSRAAPCPSVPDTEEGS